MHLCKVIWISITTLDELACVLTEVERQRLVVNLRRGAHRSAALALCEALLKAVLLINEVFLNLLFSFALHIKMLLNFFLLSLR